MKKALRLLLPLTILAAVLWPGCYTIVMHPSDDDGYRASQVSDCSRCHPDYNAYPYGHYYSPYPSYWWDYPHYSGYYANPWWWSLYDYPYAGGEEGGEGDETDRGTKFDRRDPSTPPPPPYVYPGLSLPTRPGILDYPSGGGGGLGSGTGTGTSRPKTDSTGTPTTTGNEEGGGADEVKTDRQTPQERPTPQSEPTVKPPETKPQEPAKEQPKKDDDKKRPRHSGGINR